jgi:hypothetical protein
MWRWVDLADVIMANPSDRYWQFLVLFSLGLVTMHTLLRPTVDTAVGYTTLLGMLGLGIEATLPLPQLYSNYKSQSCKGFRLSVLGNWLFGDAMKMMFFFMNDADAVPWAFKLCGCFQACCDVGLGVQYALYGEGQGGIEREVHHLP